MKLRSATFLGLALGDRSISCAELSVTGDTRRVRRVATFMLPDGVTLDQAGHAGQLLATFLRQHKFRSSHAVVGVPARWLLAAEREVPPTSADQICSILRLQAERLSLGENAEMVFDYTGRIEPAGGGKVLLIGILRQQLDRVSALLEAAGVSVVAITPTSLALASGLQHEPQEPMLVLASQGAELVWQQKGMPRLLRHVAVTMNGHGKPLVTSLGSELHRTVTLAPVNGAGPARELLLWDGVGLSEQQVSDLSTRIGISVRTSNGLSLLGIQSDTAHDPTSATDEEQQFSPALALALIGSQRRTLPLDFRHSRLAPPTQRRLGRRTVWGIALGTVAVLGIASLLWNVRAGERELESLQSKIDGMKEDVTAAEHMLDRVAYARGFFDARPPLLECLREITLAFDDNEPIWATSVNLRENGKGQLIGKAADLTTILALRSRLQNNQNFSEVQQLQMTEVNAAGGRSKEQSFTIGFTFKATE